MTASLISTGNTNSSIMKLPHEVFVNVLSFLEPQDLACSARVCRSWNRHVKSEVQWKIQCQNLLDLSSETDPRSYVPEASSYKAIFRVVYANILGASVYERHIGGAGSVPRIPKGLSLRRWNQHDLCDPTQTKKIGPEHVWMYIPSHIEIDSEGVALNKVDDPDDAEAPLLLRREADLVQRVSRTVGFGARPENSVLKVPVTINNIKVLFEHPKTGNPSTYSYIWDQIVEQHGNKRSAAGWVCMRRDVIGRNLPFAEQQALAGARGVVLSELLPRILFNCLGHVRSGAANIYPDGQNPWTYARTSTLTRDSQGNAWPSGCGVGSPSGLIVDHAHDILDSVFVGVAVVLPAEILLLSPLTLSGGRTLSILRSFVRFLE